ncbi:GPI mannosyltransferase 4-like [Varroa destructor]|uniref:Mannosyltransferase n=1 Tax=Varroa destructor TaxID=109461 RepID=A0A7M7K224_VARDE|nr:GPI mannosyltransferase 4-like [Varroa destructor]XP_022659209.1 GPI mannosyltransferase 4-like [Varroa destructor]XP_022659210.1 GPI mannosyltransferase 4-like [Varroa destructor]XP_022659211.1 GPI mannosyltransferase 4-like [Varroa destructor]XP_022659212.1 GPI mannosyltransferase 4-like [Varroa destructor]
MGRRLDRTTKVLLALRVASVLVPQYGYIHADEFFQSTEISSGDILGTDAYRPWEFTSSRPIRSAAFVHLFAFVPYQLLRIVEHTPYLRLVLPRLVACTLSFLVDAVAFRIKGLAAVKVTASSYLAFTYFTRTFSNLTETILFSLLLLMSVSTVKTVCVKVSTAARDNACTTEANGKGEKKDTGKKEAKKGTKVKNVLMNTKGGAEQTEMAEMEVCKFVKQSPDSCLFLYASIISAGVFNRPTFICFAIMPIVHRFWKTTFANFIGSCVRLAILALPAATVFVILDSVYYRGLAECLADPLGSVVVTPFNFLLYNSKPSNLTNHGLHPRWLHLLVNIPIIFGAHSLFFYCDFYRLIRRPVAFDADSRFLLNCMIVPTTLLSLFPHQEPRFLLPLVLPFALLHAQKVFRSSRSRFFWYSFNFFLSIFFGFLHQASVVPTQMYSGIKGKVIYYQTYMPPRHLSPVFERRIVVDLKEIPLAGLEATLRKHHEGYLVYPSGAESVVATALQNAVCSVKDGTALWPHFATEFLLSAWRTCSFDLNCLFLDSMVLNRMRFLCESVL